MTRSSWRRRLWTAAALAALALVAAVLLSWAALRSPRVRRWAVARVAATVEARTGVAVGADDVTIAPLRGEVTVTGLSASVPGSPPFLTVGHLHAVVDVASLRSDRIRITALAVDDVHVDISSPLPDTSSADTADAGRASPPAVDVASFSVRNGTVTIAPLPPLVTARATVGPIRDLAVTGSFVGGHADVELIRAAVTVHPRGEAPVDLVLAASAETGPGNRFALHRALVTGPGVDLEAHASGALGPPVTATATAHLDLEPDRVLPGAGVGGAVSAELSFALPDRTGSVRVDARRLRAGAVRPMLDPSIWQSAGLEGTLGTVAATATFALPEDAPVQGVGSAELTWLGPGPADEPEERRAAASVGVAFGPDAHVTVDASLLPDAAGSRRITGAVDVPDLRRPAAAALDDVRVLVDVDDIASAWADLRRRWPAAVPDVPPDVPAHGPLRVDARIDGPVSDPTAAVTASWQPAPGSHLRLEGDGRPARIDGRVTAMLDDVDLGVLRPGLAGRVSGRVDVTGRPTAFVATADVTGRALAAGPDTPVVDALSARLTTDGSTLELARLDARSGSRVLTASGSAAVESPVRTAALHVEARAPDDGLDRALADVVLAGGSVHVDVPELRIAGMLAAARIDLPLAALGDLVETIPVERSAGPVHVAFFAPAVDSCLLAAVAASLDRPERVRAALDGELWLDPADPTASFGAVTLHDLELATEALAAHSLAPFRVRLAHRRAVLEPTGIEAGATAVAVAAEVALSPGWTPDRPPLDAVDSFSADLAATLSGATLTPYLAGGVADGPVDVTVTASGSPGAPVVSARIEGPGASFFWPTPYATKIQAPTAQATVTATGDALLDASATLNGGSLRLTGSRTSAGTVEASVDLADVRYRLDFGLRALLGGTVNADLAADGSGTVTGRVVVERGILDRPVDLQRDLLPRLLAPVTTVGTERNVLDAIALDVAVDTVTGVRVKNNLADLRVRWDRLAVRGTAWNPALVGRLDIDPGGLVFALGQTVRIDRGTATFTGDPLTDPILDLATTSSLEDPSLAGAGAATSAGLEGAVATGLAGYLGERLAAGLGGNGGVTHLTIRPVLVFGEADPSARLTVTQELSRSVAFAVSVDLRQAQRQTYLLEVGKLRALPTLTGQVFTNDQGHHGATLQQSFELGGGRPDRSRGLLLRRIEIDAPEQIPRKALRRAVGLRKGDPLPEGAAVDAELELIEHLRRLGWPDARVDAALVPLDGGRRADLHIAVDPRVRVRIDFTGEQPPTGSRELVSSLYRGDIWEDESLGEMRRATVRVFRSLGWLAPEVDVSVVPETASEPRRVTIHTTTGRRIDLERVAFEGVPPDAADTLTARFAGPVERIELAVGVPDAVRRVEDTLAMLGYPDGRVLGHTLSEDGRTLTVELAPGPRTVIAAVALTGLSPADTAAIGAELPVATGDPARRDRIALAAATVEDALRSRGHVDARVRPVIEPAEDPLRVAVRLVASPGPSYRVAAVTVDGARSTSRRFALRLADIGPDALLSLDEVRSGRRALLATGLFTSVVPAVAKDASGTATVTYRVEERPRFSVAYGVRWESSLGTSAVLDAVDRNFVGRGLTLGVRALYEPKDRSARLYFSSPSLLGSANALEIYLLRRRRILPSFFTDLIDDTTEAALQLSRALSADVTARVYGRYRVEHLFEKEPDFFFPLDTRITHPYLGVQLIFDSRDDPVLARRGVFASIDVSGSDRALGSDFAYLRTFGQLNLYRPVGQVLGRSASWAQSVRIGLARAHGQELLRDVRFFAGGEYSVRGYPTEGLGPREVLGDRSRPLGGEALLVLNEELRVQLPLDLVGIVFVDAGQVWATSGDVDVLDLAASTGLGVRAATPIGIVRFDAAYPFDRRPGDSSYALYLGFGSVF